ncbi:MAG TPA: TetR/AcrR family transcriptional regulator [Mycobacteriales bacterium]|jgi:AcrR family transcriptional regulator|nr:TetR/AcrR family transcriptional regulator [Mycobacteriales bacterium]
MATEQVERSSARDRLLAAANELFYAEGVHTVGIDRVIEHAGVAKASLYSTFGSKDGLIRAYLAGRHQDRRERVLAEIARHESPRERVLAVFDVLEQSCADPRYRGCAFVNASAEAPAGGVIDEAAARFRDWLRSLFTELGQAAGALEPELLAQQLMLAYDGAGIAVRLDRDRSAAAAARTVAATLVAAATGRPAGTSNRRKNPSR